MYNSAYWAGRPGHCEVGHHAEFEGTEHLITLDGSLRIATSFLTNFITN